MFCKKLIIFLFTSFILLLNSAAVAQSLQDTANLKIEALKELIEEASVKGINTLREQTTVRTAEIFLDYANWDEANITMNTELFALVTAYKNNSSEMASLLPDFERNDVLAMLNESIAVLTKVISGEYKRQDAPNIDWTNVSHLDDQLLYNNKPVFIADYTWKPATDLLTEFHGNQGGYFLTPSYVTDEFGTIRSNKISELASKDSGSIGFVFLNNKNVPDWSKTKYGPDFEMRTDTYTAYDIDNPGARELLGNLIAGTVPYMADKKYAELGYMLCNEPHFFTQKTGDKLAWASGPVSEFTKDKFREWLANKHVSIDRLNTLWSTAFTSFNNVTIEIPIDTSNKGTAMWYDWALFNMYRVTEWYKFLKSEIKQYDNDAKVHLKIMPNLWSENWRIHGIDLEALTNISGVVGNDSGSDYNHMWKSNLEWQDHYGFDWRELCMAYDFLKSVAPNKVNYNTELHYLSTGRSRDLYMNPLYARATFWMAHTLGLTASQTWFWARREDGSPRNGVNVGNGYAGSNNHQPRVTNEVALTMIDLNAHSDLVMKMQRQRKPIRIFYSKTSAINKEEHMDEVFHLYEKLHFEGIPLGFVTKNILDTQSHLNWDVVLVHSNEYITTDELASLQNYLDNGGTIIKDSESLVKNEYGESIISSLNTNNGGTILSASSLDSFKTQALTIIETKLLSPEVSVLETNANGIKTCVWKCVKNDLGNNVISIVNIGNKQSTLNLELKEKEGTTELTDLLKGVNISNQFTLAPYEMLFLEVKDSAALTSILPPNPYGFENTDVLWSSSGHDVTVPGDIVESWTQNVGFEQSTEQVKNGSFSMKCDLVANAGGNPKLQTWRSNKNKEHEFTTEIASYTASMWVYLSGDTPDGVKISLDSHTSKPQVYFDLSTVEKNKWINITGSSSLVSDEALDTGWLSFSMSGIKENPSLNSKIFFDDITFIKAQNLSSKELIMSEWSNIEVLMKKIKITAPINSSVEVYAIDGDNILNISKTKTPSILTAQLTKGVYVVKTVNGKKVFTKKVMVK